MRIGPSGETWTHGLLTPSQARYQLRHTRIFLIKIILTHFILFCNTFSKFYYLIYLMLFFIKILFFYCFFSIQLNILKNIINFIKSIDKKGIVWYNTFCWARVAESADAHVWGACGQPPYGFKSRLSHHSEYSLHKWILTFLFYISS